MNEIEKLAKQLRQLSKQASHSAGRTNLEKLATIALIHENMIKQSSKAKAVETGMSTAKKLLLGAGVGAGTIGAGVVGHERGRKAGRQKGQKEMYYAALPYVRGAHRRASRAEAIAKYVSRRGRKKPVEKQAKARQVAKALGVAGLAAAPPTAAYYYGKSKGKRKGRLRGRTEVAQSALRRISRENYRFRKAVNYIMSQKRKQKGGG